jgi:hypothetical protein
MEQQQQNQEQQQQHEQLQLQQAEVESDDDEEEHDNDEVGEEVEDDSLVLDNAILRACQSGHMETLVSLLDSGKDVNCVGDNGMNPVVVF